MRMVNRVFLTRSEKERPDNLGVCTRIIRECILGKHYVRFGTGFNCLSIV
jgi:hypothetical protein